MAAASIHLTTRYHGVLAPGSSWRRQIAQASRASSDPCADACCAQGPAKPASKPLAAPSAAGSTSPVAQPSGPAALPQEAPSAEPPKPRSRTSTSYVSRAELMKRTLGINPLLCPVCQATMTLLAVITKQDVILKVLSHLNVPRYALTADEPSVAYHDMTGEPVAAVAHRSRS